MIKTKTLALVFVIAAFQLLSRSFSDTNRFNSTSTSPPSEKIISHNEEPDSMAFPLEVINHHTQNEITVQFDKSATIVNEFEYSFEIYFLEAVIVKVGIVSSLKYRHGEVYRIDSYVEGKGGVDLDISYMIKLQNTLVLLAQISDRSIGKAENNRFKISTDMEGVVSTELFRGIDKVIDDQGAYVASLGCRGSVPITSNTSLKLKQRRSAYNADENLKFKNRFKPISIDRMFRSRNKITDTLYVEQTEPRPFSNSKENKTNVDTELHNEEGAIWLFQPDGISLCYSYDFTEALETIMPTSKSYKTYNRYDCGGTPHQIAMVLESKDINLNDLSQKYMIDDNLFLFEITNDSSRVLKKSYETYSKYFNDNLYNWEDHLKPPLAYQDFVESNPVFIVKDPFGRFLQLTRHDYILQPACEPVIYIYSDSQKEYQIKLGSKIKTLSTYPHHDVKEGWRVKGSDNGSITLSQNGRKYKYLFWEGTSGYLPPKTDGFLVHVDSLSVFFLESLKQLGLNDNETEDFKEYWLPQFNQPDVYYRISFYSQDLIDQLFPLEITPKPKQVIRVLMDYEVVGKDRIDLSTPNMVSVDRIEDELFVEWGGIKRPPKL